MLAIEPICAFGDGTVSPPNPIGEQEYASHILARMAPIGIAVGGFFLGWLLDKAWRRAKNGAGGQGGIRSVQAKEATGDEAREGPTGGGRKRG